MSLIVAHKASSKPTNESPAWFRRILWYSPIFTRTKMKHTRPTDFLKQTSTALPPAHSMCWTWGMTRSVLLGTATDQQRPAEESGSGQWRMNKFSMIPGQGLELIQHIEFFKNCLPSLFWKIAKLILTYFWKLPFATPVDENKHKCSWLLLCVYKFKLESGGQSREA